MVHRYTWPMGSPCMISLFIYFFLCTLSPQYPFPSLMCLIYVCKHHKTCRVILSENVFLINKNGIVFHSSACGFLHSTLFSNLSILLPTYLLCLPPAVWLIIMCIFLLLLIKSLIMDDWVASSFLLDITNKLDVMNSFSYEPICELPWGMHLGERLIGPTNAQVHPQVPPDSFSIWYYKDVLPQDTISHLSNVLLFWWIDSILLF